VNAKRMIFGLLIGALFVGLVSMGLAQALSFDNWEGTWFTVKASEKGKAGPVFPAGGEVDANNEKTSTSYLAIDTFDIGTPVFIETLNITVPAFAVAYCTFNGTTWVNDFTVLPILGGEPNDFLAFFAFERQETASVLQSSWIPLEMKATESRQTVGQITSASFKNLGGIFLEEIDGVVSYGGIGSVTFKGSFISSDQVADRVPAICRSR